MAKYEFKLPDIGEGIAEAEIVAWHVKVGDTIGEDQQIADMMTDKATVEMESPGRGQGGRAGGRGRRPDPDRLGAGGDRDRRRGRGGRSSCCAVTAEERAPLADGAEEPTAGAGGRDSPPLRCRRGAGAAPPVRRSAEASKPEVADRAQAGRAHVLASPAVRARARDLGIDLAQVKTASDRIRHSDLDAYLLYNGGSVSGRGAARAQGRDDQGRRPSPQDRREHAGGEAPDPAFHLGRGVRRHRPRGHAGDDEPRPRLEPQADPAALPDHRDGQGAARLADAQRHL